MKTYSVETMESREGAADDLPVWISDTEIDPGWIENRTDLKCTRCVVQDISNATRKQEKARDGATLKLSVYCKDEGSPISLIIKQVPKSGMPFSARLGLAREALFYSTLAKKIIKESSITLPRIIPKVYYSWGSLKSGGKTVIMEDLSEDFVDSGIFFGPGNPNNWSRDLNAMLQTVKPAPPSSRLVAMETFQAIAVVHATYWRDTDLLAYPWLRCCRWLQGQEKDSWMASQSIIQNSWQTYLEKERNGEETSIRWDPQVKAVLSKAMDGISWEAQLKRLNMSSHWTVVHGDFWPGNVMYTANTSSSEKLRLLDWEMCGLGSGPQDLGQYVISNMDPEDRRSCDGEIVRAYYDNLISHGVTNFSWDECWREYYIGGTERWLWFLAYFLTNGPDGWCQFFHDQIAEFVRDHNVKPDDIVQPRP